MVQVSRTCTFVQVPHLTKKKNSHSRQLNHRSGVRRIGRDKGIMKKKDKGRKWMWGILGSIAALQIYFVQELLAALALFALGFVAIAMVFASLYMLHRVWAVTVERAADSQHPIMVAVRHGVYSVEDLARRPFRRPGSAAAR